MVLLTRSIDPGYLGFGRNPDRRTGDPGNGVADDQQIRRLRKALGGAIKDSDILEEDAGRLRILCPGDLSAATHEEDHRTRVRLDVALHRALSRSRVDLRFKSALAG
ncbi:hypothetical protein CCR95_23140 [Thiocystis minor]|nr:hypothetical protein [Thiocystis minor]